MGFEEVFVIKGNMPNNAQPVCNNAECISITEVSVDIHCWMAGLAELWEDMDPWAAV